MESILIVYGYMLGLLMAVKAFLTSDRVMPGEEE